MKKAKLIKYVFCASLALLGLISVCFYSVFDSYINKVFFNMKIIEKDGNMLIHCIDVGEADAFAINFPNGQVALIDTGAEDTSDKLLIYLENHVFNNMRNKVVDYLFVSHCDSDHTGGLLRILKNYEVKNIIRAKQYLTSEGIVDDTAYYTNNSNYSLCINYIKSKGNNLITVKNSMTFELGLAKLQVFCFDRKYTTSNDYSYYIRAEYMGNSILFTGDAGYEVENDLMGSFYDCLKSDVLKISHHGDNSATSDALLNCVQPKYAIISVGVNSNGHPTADTINKLNNHQIDCYRTDQNGNILVVFEKEINIFCGNYSFTACCKWGYYCVVLESLNLLFLCVDFCHVLKNHKRNKNLQ